MSLDPYVWRCVEALTSQHNAIEGSCMGEYTKQTNPPFPPIEIIIINIVIIIIIIIINIFPPIEIMTSAALPCGSAHGNLFESQL